METKMAQLLKVATRRYEANGNPNPAVAAEYAVLDFVNTHRATGGPSEQLIDWEIEDYEKASTI